LNTKERKMSNEIRDKVARLKRELAEAQRELELAEARCNNGRHDWAEAKYEPIYHKAYTIPGDEPGTMGIDFRGPCYVPAKTDQRWTRTCKCCGKVETTTRATEEVSKKPQF
jgi:hypothetical protein